MTPKRRNKLIILDRSEFKRLSFKNGRVAFMCVRILFSAERTQKSIHKQILFSRVLKDFILRIKKLKLFAMWYSFFFIFSGSSRCLRAQFGATTNILSVHSTNSNALWHKSSKTLFPHLRLTPQSVSSTRWTSLPICSFLSLIDKRLTWPSCSL